jgi:hypothetical protein
MKDEVKAKLSSFSLDTEEHLQGYSRCVKPREGGPR